MTGEVTTQVKLYNHSDQLLHRQTYSYDAVGNVLTEETAIQGMAGIEGVTSPAIRAFTYDSYNRPHKTTHPSGLVTYNVYNGVGAVKEVWREAQTGLSSYRYWRGDAWDEWGKVYLYTLGNGIETMIARDPGVGGSSRQNIYIPMVILSTS